METKLLFTYAMTPLHAGTGRGVGVIDLPIAREVATGLPYLPGSSLKGVLRDRCTDNDDCTTIFGPSTDNINESNLQAGAAQFTDQRLLLLPVRSLAGTFAWVTSPFILQRLRRECESIGQTNGLPSVPQPAKEQIFTAVDQPSLLINPQRQTVVLEDLELESAENVDVAAWATWLGRHLFDEGSDWLSILNTKFAVVHDDILSFLLETATEVIARIRLEDDTKTVTKGGLWYEENLPAETILSGFVVAHQVEANEMSPATVLDKVADLTNELTQLGGNATVGRGLCRLIMQ